jgi:predicted DNA-binding protein
LAPRTSPESLKGLEGANDRLGWLLIEILRRRAKAVAALRGETVSDVVREALEAYILEAMEEADDVRAADEVEARLASGDETLHEHEDLWRELAALGSGEDVPPPVQRRRPS